MLRSLIIQIDSLGILKRELALEQQRREKIISDGSDPQMVGTLVVS